LHSNNKNKKSGHMISSATLTGTRLLPSWSRRCLLGGASPLEEKKRTATKMNGLFDSVYSASYVFCEEEKLRSP